MLPMKSNSRRRQNAVSAGAAGDKIDGYNKVVGATETDGFIDEQWSNVTPEIEVTPWKTIVIILTLFIAGTICIGCAALEWFTDMNGERESNDRILAMSVIGSLMIIPGGYYFYILSCILLHKSGYTMDDIRRLG
ncbi:transmembrane protein 230 [Scaptodrosophila lebanonensis]|uniref:Transmembrane protein 230 n=1 Tax=Drosophila lebanonensis TaxID=7225 RepID=A0A6J2TWV6_DROLE|nr:transmembrane protein 230 [Scaptodrosophila lebanonensis]